MRPPDVAAASRRRSDLGGEMARRDLTTLVSHAEPYVTVAQLARYWQVSRRQIYKHIDAGTLDAIRLGPRLSRIRTCAALEFAERAQMGRAEVARKLRYSCRYSPVPARFCCLR